MKKLTFNLMFAALAVGGVNAKEYQLASPDGLLKAVVNAGDKLTYEVTFGGDTVIAPSALGMTLSNGLEIGARPKVKGVTRRSVDEMVASPFYRADSVRDNYNELTLNLGKGWSVEFRAYDDGVAYRFVSKDKKPFNVVSETAEYVIPQDADVAVPYVKGGTPGDFMSQLGADFENHYTEAKISQLDNGRLVFLPMSVGLPEGVRLTFTEVNRESYPGMFLNPAASATTFKGVFAPYPKKVQPGGYIPNQLVVAEREEYLAKVDGPRSFPWRVAVVTKADKDLAASDLTYLLAEPSRLSDTSWIRPGKVAWDWWNNWNIDGVDFESGVNNDTYKHYIDFASENGIEYVILDDGWSDLSNADLFKVVPAINLPMLIDYASEKNVGLILWAGYYPFERDMERVCKHYSDMGIKGFKIDFMNRDDQLITDFNSRAAETAARHHLLLDLHGSHNLAGLNRTYPNVLNAEGVFGLEQMKWAPESVDQVKYDVMVPFLRQVAGPLDYTQGAMLNGSQGNYHPSNSEPMSQGTRCRQLALYVVFDSPLNMLCDSPSNYRREQECTDFIAEIPTTWDDTRVLDGKMGEYIVTARRKGSTWYVGGITDRNARDITIDLAALGLAPGGHTATLYRDGVNAHRRGRDYRRETLTVNPSAPFKVHLAPGGGFALRID